MRTNESKTVFEPLKGADLKKVNQMKEMAKQLLKCLELEKNGIRDGDGFWHGSDPIDAIISDLVRLHCEGPIAL